MDLWMTMTATAATLAPLVGVPLGMITLYLRAIREQQTSRHGETLQRIAGLDEAIRALGRSVCSFERDYTTKEEWLRESLHTRRHLERLTEMVARLQAGVASTSDRAARLIRTGEPVPPTPRSESRT